MSLGSGIASKAFCVGELQGSYWYSKYKVGVGPLLYNPLPIVSYGYCVCIVL